MTAVTAKVECSRKTNEASPDQFELNFTPDYADGRNAEWSLYTPALAFSMIVKASAAEHFELGGKYTVTFEPTAG